MLGLFMISRVELWTSQVGDEEKCHAKPQSRKGSEGERILASATAGRHGELPTANGERRTVNGER